VLERSHEGVLSANRRSRSLEGLQALVGKPFGLVHLLDIEALGVVIEVVAFPVVFVPPEPFLEVRVPFETSRVKHQARDVFAYGNMIGNGFKLAAALRMIQ
jgi:hypothetical protein